MAIRCPKDGTVVWSPITNDAGSVSRLLSDFEELRTLGSGGFGTVALARSKIDHHLYAIKKVPLEIVNGYKKVTREVIGMAKLCHPNVLRYHASWLEESTVGLIKYGSESSSDTEVVPTGPMLCIQLEDSQRLIIDGGLTNRRIWDIFEQLLEGLSYIHDKGVRHGDLSASKIFFDSLGTLKIGDFGLTMSSPEGEFEEGQHPPTPCYCTPEMKANKEAPDKKRSYSLKSDIYSLGVILLELLAKYPKDSMDRHRELPDFIQSRKWPHALVNLNEEAKQLIIWMTKENPTYRPTARSILTSPSWRQLGEE